MDWTATRNQSFVAFDSSQLSVARFDGIYNNRVIAGTNKPSLHAEGRALDIGLEVRRPAENTIGDGLFQISGDVAAQAGFQEIIWNRQIWSSARPLVHPYTGHDPHTGHVHVGFTRDASQRTSLPVILLIKIGMLRTGLEDLATAFRNAA